jgi:hypothetical protein
MNPFPEELSHGCFAEQHMLEQYRFLPQHVQSSGAHHLRITASFLAEPHSHAGFDKHRARFQNRLVML